MWLCVAAPAAAQTPLLPDLVADPPGDSAAPEIYSDGIDPRLLLRFDGFVHNRGAGPLEIRSSGGVVRQRIVNDDGTSADWANDPMPQVLFESGDGHNHWHLRNAARYSLWNESRSAPVAPSMKVGFCLVDSALVEPHGPQTPAYTMAGSSYCGQGQPAASDIVMGVSPGWRDIYGSGLAFQWIDISEVQPGRYWLRSDIDPDGVVRESDEVNPGSYAASPSIVPGYRAESQHAGTLPAIASAIDLGATRFDDPWPGEPGAVEYSIVTRPAHGQLDRPVGSWFQGNRVHYTPEPGYRGPDSFSFTARDSSSVFPRNPASAAVTLSVDTPPTGAFVMLAGIPSYLRTRARAQLVAFVVGEGGPLHWSVNGRRGGSRRAGRVSPEGLYTAPAKVPRRGFVTLRVETASGAGDEARLRIRRARRPRAAPSPGALPLRRGELLSRLRLARHGRKLLVSVAAARRGRIRINAKRGGRHVDSCSVRAKPRRTVTCSLDIPRWVARRALLCKLPRTRELGLAEVRVKAELVRRGRVLAVRRASAR